MRLRARILWDKFKDAHLARERNLARWRRRATAAVAANTAFPCLACPCPALLHDRSALLAHLKTAHDGFICPPDRLVAIKVPHAALISQPEDAEAYRTEARTVANLDHPHIVQVFDVGSTADFPCYIVTK